nr:MAG TPA: RNA polymerase sigma factor [Caudoviricetes sp.]
MSADSEREAVLWERYRKDKSAVNLDELIRFYAPLVKSVAKRMFITLAKKSGSTTYMPRGSSACGSQLLRPTNANAKADFRLMPGSVYAGQCLTMRAGRIVSQYRR